MICFYQILTFAKVEKNVKKMGTVPNKQIQRTENIDKMRLVEQTKKLNICGLSPFFSLTLFLQPSQINAFQSNFMTGGFKWNTEL